MLTLLVLAAWLGLSERALLRVAAAHWRGYFPRLLDQGAFTRRARSLAWVAAALVSRLAWAAGAAEAGYDVVDGVPVPLARRCRGTRSRVWGEVAAIGRGGADRDWYYGCQVLLVVSERGLITGFALGPANTDARYLADAVWCWRRDPTATPGSADCLPPSHATAGRRVGPTGPIWPRVAAGMPSQDPVLADRGFRGTIWQAHWAADYGVTVLPPASYQGPTAAADRRWHAAARQVVETVNALLEAVCALPFPGAKTRAGLLARIAAKLLAVNLGVHLNRAAGRRPFALATLLTW